jgi:hypothetical protein
MKIYLRHLKPLGFKGSGMWEDAKWSAHYYKVNNKTHTITVIGNLAPATISQFTLTPSNFKKFRGGKLALVPPDCCNASGGPSIEKFKLIYSGECLSPKKLKELLGTLPNL